MREILAVALDAGFVPYKAPYWVIEEMMLRRLLLGMVYLKLKIAHHN